MRTYEEWIAAYIDRHDGNVWMKCLEACEEMLLVFPELTMVKGIVISPHGKRWCHCWLITSDGERVDPTSTQFGYPVSYGPPKGRLPPVAPRGTVRT